MKYLKNNCQRNDCWDTPEYLVKELIHHFKPTGKIVEPCCGNGAILKYLPPNTSWCEIKKGRDFFEFNDRVDWVFTNPPWSIFRKFLIHSLDIADNILFIATLNHFVTKARLRDVATRDFGFKEVYLFDTPREFPQMGFQYSAVHLQKNYKGDIKINLYKEHLWR